MLCHKAKTITQAQFKKLNFFVLLAWIFFPGNGHAQQGDSTNGFKIGGYIDAYYALYNDSVGTNNYQKFPSISPKSNAFGLNVVQLTGQYNSKKLRAVVTLHYGDFPRSAWASSFNVIQEANLGIKLSKKFWLDAGFFKTHVGTEAFSPKDNITSSLSIMTFHEPFYQAGIKLSYAPNDKIALAFHALNGYNIFDETNKKKSFGISFSYSLADKGFIAYNNLFGDEFPDSINDSHFRFLNNIVFNYQLSAKVKIVIGGDVVSQQNSGISNAKKTAVAYGGLCTIKFQASPKFGIYARAEVFNDDDGFLSGIIIDTRNEPTGLKVWGITAGLEYKPMENSYIRLEARQLQMNKDQEIFYWKDKNESRRMEVMLHAGVWF